MSNPTDFPEPTLIPVNGVELEVFEAGQENAGNPIVLCHGWPEHAFSWRHQVPALAAAGYHVIVPNQRGYGNSSRPTEVTEYDIEHLSGDLIALLDHYEYEDATFVGHDWGAMVVWGLACSWIQSFLTSEGIVLNFTGRGKIYVQSHNPDQFGHTLGPMLPPREAG